MQVIVYRNPDDTVSVVHPTPEYQNRLDEVIAKDVPPGTSYRIINRASLPTRDGRARWRWHSRGVPDVLPE